MSCSSAEKKDEGSPDELFKRAEELDKDERFEEALQRYVEIRNKHPYSRFATLSELRIADIHFNRENYIEAQAAYQLFRELHPKHPDVDYVTFRIALSYFNQLPSTIDRDLSIATKSIQYFEEVIKTYSDSKYVAEAKVKRAQAKSMLAKKEIYIADFYFKRQMFDSALVRYEKIVTQFSEENLTSQALLGAAVSAFESGDREKGQKYISRLLNEFGQTPEAGKGQEAKKKYGLQ